jgi:Type IV secretion system pilin
MIKRLKIIAASVAVLVCTLGLAQPALAADLFSGACGSGAGGSAVCAKQAKSNPLTGTGGTLSKVTRLIGVVAGSAAVLMILIGGFMYITSGGDSSKVSSAKNTVIYAAVGLVIIVIAQAIVGFVIGKL